MIIWICREVNFLSLSMLSLQFFISVRGVTTIFQGVTIQFLISVKGVTTIFHFCPEGYNDFYFVWWVAVDHYICPGENLALCHLYRVKYILKIIVQGVHPKKLYCPGG